MTDIPDYIGQKAVRLVNDAAKDGLLSDLAWPNDRYSPAVIATARALMMEPPEPPSTFVDEARATFAEMLDALMLKADVEIVRSGGYASVVTILATKFRDIAERAK